MAENRSKIIAERGSHFIEKLGGEIISKPNPSKKKAILKELEEAFCEAKEIKDGKKHGLTLEQILLAE